MGCDQSREKQKEADANATAFARANDFAVATPLPLHIYQEYTRAYTIFNLAPSPTNSSSSPTNVSSAPSTPKSHTSLISPKSQTSRTSLKRSYSVQLSSSVPKASKAFHNMSSAHLTKLYKIAEYKFSNFSKFSQLVKEEILLHIDRELRNRESF